MNLIFILFLISLLYPILFWGFKSLPRENRQILAAVPGKKNPDNAWHAINLTYYGLIVAASYTFAVMIFILLAASVGISLPVMVTMIALLMVVVLPSARMVAAIVEKKKNTFTVGGAAFVAIVTTPLLLSLAGYPARHMGYPPLPTLPILSAMAIAYGFGEGLGRLACISFGCCYGKALSECSPGVQRMFKHVHLTFFGPTKKIAYASNLEGVPVLPIQAITAVIYTTAAIAGVSLFLSGHFYLAYILLLTVTQIWRVFSEFFRDDFRGTLRFSAYQLMAVIGVCYSLAILLVLPGNVSPRPDLVLGISQLWQPGVILTLEAVAFLVFLVMGRSRTTGAVMSIHVNREAV